MFTDWIDRAIAWHQLQALKAPRDQIAASLKPYGDLLIKRDVVDCGPSGITGQACWATAYAVLGTNQEPSQFGRNIQNSLGSMGYSVNGYKEGDENINSHNKADLAVNVSWNASIASLGVVTYCSTGFGSSCKFQEILLPTSAHYSRLILLRLNPQVSHE